MTYNTSHLRYYNLLKEGAEMQLKAEKMLTIDVLGVPVKRSHKSQFWNLNDLNKLKATKRLDNWIRLDHTKDIIAIVEKKYNLESAMVTKRGKNGGTLAHPTIAASFLMWLSPELHVEAAELLLDHRICVMRDKTGISHGAMCNAIRDYLLAKPGTYVYGSETSMVNFCAGIQKGSRDTIGIEDSELVIAAQNVNTNLIKKGIKDINERKAKILEYLDMRYGGDII